MKIRIIILGIFLLISQSSQAQFKFPKIVKDAVNALNPTNPSQAEIGDALKEALSIGITASTGRLSVENGFLGNAAVKLLFPPEALKIEKALRGIGMNKACDDFILSLNKAAELAAKEAKPIFISSLQEMSVQDATKILLTEQNDAATRYFESNTSKELEAKFKPVIQNSLDKTQATKYWADLSSSYNKIPLVSKINSDLVAYATQKAMAGLFLEISQEELKIRKNSSLRSSPLLKKVFAYADSGAPKSDTK